tara:strand:+ start:5197 stop:5370 length:174 start_codon:yes stop_codon:yes gene_type:complete
MFKKLFSNFYLSALAVFLSGLISVYDNVMNVIFFKTLKMDEKTLLPLGLSKPKESVV